MNDLYINIFSTLIILIIIPLLFKWEPFRHLVFWAFKNVDKLYGDVNKFFEQMTPEQKEYLSLLCANIVSIQSLKMQKEYNLLNGTTFSDNNALGIHYFTNHVMRVKLNQKTAEELSPYFVKIKEQFLTHLSEIKEDYKKTTQ